MHHKNKSKESAWHFLGITEVAQRLGSRPAGLTTKEVARLSRRYSPNTIKDTQRIHMVGILARQFHSVLVVILLVAAVLSFILHDLVDGYVILAALVANVALGFWQEWQAERAMSNLASLVTWNATVVRDGHQHSIPIEQVVPGDVLVLRVGERVPADLRLLRTDNLEVDESLLTGESLPSNKNTRKVNEGDAPLAERSNMAFMGTLVVRGSGLGYAVETGAHTAIGEIHELVRSYREGPTPLQEKIERLGRVMGYCVIILACAIFVLGMARGVGRWDMFKTAVALAVSAVPEGLLIAVTVVLAFGARDLLKKKALVRRLISAETLGATTVICVDKTGTLTFGQLRLARVSTLHHDVVADGEDAIKVPSHGGEELLWALRAGLLCNDASYIGLEMAGDPVDKALLLAGSRAGFDQGKLLESFPRVGSVPFEETTRYMATAHTYGARTIVFIKGAPEVVLRAASHVQSGSSTHELTESAREEFMRKAQELSGQGLKMLACGYIYTKSIPILSHDFDVVEDIEGIQGLTLLGLLGLKDPLRPEAKHALALARKARIHTIMITGDHPLTARAIVHELGLRAKQGEIKEEKDLDNIVLDGVTVFARMTPQDKLRIVDRLKADGEVVAMTGDGVNDVPALKAADIGIALGSGTQAAKDVSDIVLLDDNFTTIVEIIAQGRKILEHIRTIVFYLFSHGFGEVLVIIFSIILNTPLALLPVQILWINLATDSFTHLALAKEPLSNDTLWDVAPEKRNAPLFKASHIKALAVISILSAVATFAIYYVMLGITGDVDRARTMAFAFLGLDALFSVFSLRQLSHTIFCASAFRNKYLLGAVACGVILQVAAVHVGFLQHTLSTVSLTAFEWSIIAVAVVWRISGIELTKKLFL